jgi:hypothetical protein
VHPNPDKAWSDGEQSLDFAGFDEMMADLEPWLALRDRLVPRCVSGQVRLREAAGAVSWRPWDEISGQRAWRLALDCIADSDLRFALGPAQFSTVPDNCDCRAGLRAAGRAARARAVSQGRATVAGPRRQGGAAGSGFAATADANVSFDGKSVLFAGKQAAGDPWQIWELTLETTRCAR